jgi:hypothetical protein
MTPRDVIDRFTPEQCYEIASICLERLPPERIAQLLRETCTQDDFTVVGLAMRARQYDERHPPPEGHSKR